MKKHAQLFSSQIQGFCGSVALILVTSLLGATACGASHPYVWGSSLPVEPAASANAAQEPLRRGDTVAVIVDSQESASASPVVTSDGFIVVPLVGALHVEGKKPDAVVAELTERFRRLIEAPRVSVVVVARRVEVSVVGEVTEPGKYVLDSRDGVVTALALAGGLTEFADDDSIYVVRPSQPERIRFKMSELVRGGTSATAFRLHDGDLVVVE